MELETTARLIAAAIRQRISRGNIRFGLLARSLPPFDTYTLYESLKPDWANLRLALIGFENTDKHFPTDVATEVEQAVAWRNDANVTVPLVVILNSAIQQEKIHSLELLEPFTDQHLRRAICQQGEKEAKTNSPEKRLWHNLNVREITNSIPIVASQVAALYHALQQKGVADSLPCINLLPDPQLISYTDSNEKFRGRLKKNKETVEWLLALDNQAYRTIARALPTDGRSQHSDTFQRIKQYAQNPTLERLNQLTLDNIISIREAKKAPEQSLPSIESVIGPRPSSPKPPLSTPDLFLVDQLLNLNPDKSETQQRIVEIEAQAKRISEMFYDELSDSYEIDRNRENLLLDFLHKKGGSKEEQYEVLIDPQTKEEITSVKIPIEEEELHPLDEYMGIGSIWVHPQCWGGYINVEQLPDEITDVTDLFGGNIALPFTPLHPLDTQSPSSLLTLFNELEEQIAEPTENGNLGYLLKELSNYRRYLANYRRQFLYYPNWAIETPDLRKNIENYLMTYDRLAQRLQQICRQAQATYPDAVERAVAQFLALDVVIIDLPDKEKPQSYNVILTALHPLHLWKWFKLDQLLRSNPQILTEKEIKQFYKAVQNLPTLLNTFLLHRQMFDPPRHLTEPRLVLAGEINNPRAKETVGVPYYKPIAHQSSIIDGLKQFVELFNQFLVLYPPASLGLTLVLIDPPQLSFILNKLADLHKQDLHGARVYVYHTDERATIHDDWQAKDDEALQLFRENQQWALSVNLECHTILEINQQMQKEEIFPHIILLCDPSEAVVQSTFRTIQEDASPFGVPVQLTYDRISDTIKLIPLPTGGIFDAYAGVRNALTGELQRSVMGVGNRSTIKPKDLNLLLDSEEGANWLTIIDRPHGTLELPSNIGRRLAWQFSGSRILAVHTNERDWKQHWEPQLNRKLSDLGLPQGIEANYILDRLLELFPILPDGLIALIKKSSNGNFGDAFNEDELNQFLSIIIVLNWYRREKKGLVLIPINGQNDTDDFTDWYGDKKVISNNNYMALWLDTNGCHADILTIRSYLGTFDNKDVGDLSRNKQSLEALSEFASTLETLFVENTLQTILTPIRKALLKEKLTTAVFTASTPEIADIFSQSKETKSQWARAINELFTIAYKPHIRLLDIRVALREGTRSADEQSYRDTSDNYQRLIVKLPATFLQSVLRIREGDTDKRIEDFDIPELPDITKKKRPKRKILDFSSEKQPEEKWTPQDDLSTRTVQHEVIIKQAEQLRSVLVAYNIAIASIDVEKSQIGPRFIRYWAKLQPPAGRLNEIQKYAEDIARELGSKTIPLIDNIPGEKYVGIDLAREDPEVLLLAPHLKDLPIEQSSQLYIAMGQNPAGEAVHLDLVRLPHMLVAGSTGSGKTVFLSGLIMSLVWRHTYQDLKILLVDPKQTDFGIFSELPHLYDNRILYEPEEAIITLRELITHEKEHRTKTLRQVRCPNILELNRRYPERRLPWIVVVIDEFADIILSLEKKERVVFEKQINRLAATGRSIGIHLVLATQRPTTDVVTGTIKANIPARVSFRLPSLVDSRTILDRTGAENLLGQGDMLVAINNETQRLQGYYASHDELIQLLGNLEA